MLLRLFPIIFYCFILFQKPAKSQTPLSDKKEDPQFFLLTVGLGPTLETRYGHTVLRLLSEDGQDHNYNWGMFSFSEPNFFLNFFLGKLRYWVADMDFQRFFWQYKYYYKRRIVSDEIKLTLNQKKHLIEIINENMKPENKFFWYQYFTENCSTIPRDHLNKVLFGKIYEKFSNDYTGVTYRDYVRGNLNKPPIVSFFLDLMMNRHLDTPISKWEEMFYPLKLREYLLEMPQINDLGEENPKEKILTN